MFIFIVHIYRWVRQTSWVHAQVTGPNNLWCGIIYYGRWREWPYMHIINNDLDEMDFLSYRARGTCCYTCFIIQLPLWHEFIAEMGEKSWLYFLMALHLANVWTYLNVTDRCGFMRLPACVTHLTSCTVESEIPDFTFCRRTVFVALLWWIYLSNISVAFF